VTIRNVMNACPKQHSATEQTYLCRLYSVALKMIALVCHVIEYSRRLCLCVKALMRTPSWYGTMRHVRKSAALFDRWKTSVYCMAFTWRRFYFNFAML